MRVAPLACMLFPPWTYSLSKWTCTLLVEQFASTSWLQLSTSRHGTPNLDTTWKQAAGLDQQRVSSTFNQSTNFRSTVRLTSTPRTTTTAQRCHQPFFASKFIFGCKWHIRIQLASRRWFNINRCCTADKAGANEAPCQDHLSTSAPLQNTQRRCSRLCALRLLHLATGLRRALLLLAACRRGLVTALLTLLLLLLPLLLLWNLGSHQPRHHARRPVSRHARKGCNGGVLRQLGGAALEPGQLGQRDAVPGEMQIDQLVNNVGVVAATLAFTKPKTGQDARMPSTKLLVLYKIQYILSASSP